MSNAAAQLPPQPASVGDRERALELLREALKECGWSSNRLARELGISSGLASRWLREPDAPEKRWPGLEHALRLQQLFGIPAHLWVGPRRKASRKRR